MCPVLRGEASPLPQKELTALRDSLSRDWGHRTITTSSGPLLVMRVPAGKPDLLNHLETATDALPPLDFSEYRGAVMIGDEAHLGVSIDMLHSLVDTRRATEANWLAQHRPQLPAGGFMVQRLPSDPQRRLRAVIRVDVDRVTQLGEADFDELATLLEPIKQESPGQCRPAFAYLVAHEDHVRIEGGRFFSELEQRARRAREREERTRHRKREESYETALGHIARIEERNKRRKTPDPFASSRSDRFDPPLRSTRAARSSYSARSTRSTHLPYSARSTDTTRTTPPPVERAPADRTTRTRHKTRRERPSFEVPPAYRDHERPAHEETRQRTGPRTDLAPRETTRAPIEPPAPSDPHFASVDAHPEQYEHLKTLLRDAGYETRERFVVDGVPLALAAARPEGYPRRVLVAFSARLEEDEARRMLRVARSVGAELALAITPDAAAGVERVTLATNLKVIAPDAVMQLRLD